MQNIGAAWLYPLILAVAMLSIPGRAIEQDRARGLGDGEAKPDGTAGPCCRGASLSGLAAGVTVDHFGYSAVFLAAACVALAALFLAMPETAPSRAGPVAPLEPSEACYANPPEE